VYQNPRKNNNAGGVVSTQDNPFQYDLLPEQQGFSTEDVLWALGIWSVILSLSPVIVFYVLMVA
jgi:hypothetical protein